MIDIAIGLGLALNILFLELIGLTAGGLVAPGYLSLYLHHPTRVLITVVISVITFYTVKFLSNFMIIYGSRKMAIMILVGFIFTYLSRMFPSGTIGSLDIRPVEAIGLIIPGLIANSIDREGIVETLCTLIIGSVMVRFILIIVFGGAIWA
ncbi:MAG TPA: poly-gamma-glutamate biosynthesis protein PgsC [Candidatus Brocadiia bacterium]|nr:poly-gamma-glutamate biosynthesis protein PgsC [Candidatus Brocadiales bacterium]